MAPLGYHSCSGCGQLFKTDGTEDEMYVNHDCNEIFVTGPSLRCSVHGVTFMGEDNRCHHGVDGPGNCRFDLESNEEPQPLRIGDWLYGDCGGYFDFGESKRNLRVEAIGADWVVVRDIRHIPRFSACLPQWLTPFRVEQE